MNKSLYFYHKYMKYKKKYLELKKIELIGGNKPSINNLKNINLFDQSSFEREYLDPTNGYIWSQNAIKNYYLYGPEKSLITQLIKLLYLNANIDMVYSKTVLEGKITPYQIGFLLGKWYNYLINRDNISNIIIKYNRGNKNFDQSEINVLNSILKHYNKNQKNLEKTKLSQLERKINEYKKDKNLIDVCDFNKISEKVLEDKYTPKLKNNINELILNDIQNYKKDIEKYKRNLEKRKTSKKEIKPLVNETQLRGEYFRQSFNKIFNIEIFDMIDENLNTNDNFKLNINSEIEVTGIFSVTLSFLWNISNDKEGIKEYYRGLSEHIYSEKIEKLLSGEYPEFYETFTKKDIKPLKNSQNFNHALFILDSKTKGSLTLQTTQNVDGFGDCTETSIKNFIKILIYDYDKDEFSLEKLEQIGARNNSKIYEFFRIFNKDYHHSSNLKTNIFGEELTIRQAWIKIMSNIPGVKYRQGNREIYPGQCTIDDRNNIEVILEYLFGVKTFVDL